MMHVILPVIYLSYAPIGIMKPEAWKGAEDILLGSSPIKKSISATDIYTAKFL